MSITTSSTLKNKMIYSIYIRNHTSEGTFISIISDLDRIKNLGADIIWFLPIHPIGEKNKKGSLGCPYSIKDYRGINPDYGSLDDFKRLIYEIHKREMKVMIDVVYNHTSHDSVLFNEHPEWFYRKKDGSVGNQVGEWTDIIDLDYNNKDLWQYQVESLKYWASLGVDGFRCDVAPMVPLDFWKMAHEEIYKINSNFLWLAETVHLPFLKMLRDNNVKCHSDSEIFSVFDISYDYDSYTYLEDYLAGNIPLSRLLEYKRLQETIYPENYVKLRFLENHDFPRSAYIFKSKKVRLNWLAFTFFEKGIPLVYAGIENCDSNVPSLFDKDPVVWNNEKDISDLIMRLKKIKSDSIFKDSVYNILDLKKEGIIAASYRSSEKTIYGIFNVELKIGQVDIPVKDGNYKNLVDGNEVVVANGKINLPVEPVIFEVF